MHRVIIAGALAMLLAGCGPEGVDGEAPPAPALDPAVLASNIDGMRDATKSAVVRLSYANAVISMAPGSEESAEASTLIPVLEASAVEERKGAQWKYSDREDEMSSGRIKMATVYSSNRHEFDFPYGGPQRAEISIRNHPRFGIEAMFSIEKGQIICHRDDCDLLVRFDDQEAHPVSASGSASRSSEYVFIDGAALLLSEVQLYKRMRVQARIYQQGSPVWEFDLSDFKPDKLK